MLVILKPTLFFIWASSFISN